MPQSGRTEYSKQTPMQSQCGHVRLPQQFMSSCTGCANTRQAEARLPLCEGDDFGLLLWGLATLGAPLERFWLQSLCREASHKWHSHSGEGLGLLVWGLAQYGFSPYTTVPTRAPPEPGMGRFAARRKDGAAGDGGPDVSQESSGSGASDDAESDGDGEQWEEERGEGEGSEGNEEGEGTQGEARMMRVLGASGTLLPRMRMRRREAEWWGGFYREVCDKWEGASPRALVLMLLAVAELIGTAPDRWVCLTYLLRFGLVCACSDRYMLLRGCLGAWTAGSLVERAGIRLREPAGQPLYCSQWAGGQLGMLTS